jgi:hypothetical protein
MAKKRAITNLPCKRQTIMPQPQNKGRPVMSKFKHQFVETYDGLVGFGADRQTDEYTLMVYFQMFSDDETLRTLIKRMNDGELENAFDYLAGLLKKHFSEDEYHGLFLKDGH